MEDNPSYRQVGKEAPGRVWKGRITDRSEDRQHSSSPAFGSKTTRFRVSKGSGIGPGNYQGTTLTSHRVLGCIDKSRRFRPRQYATITPGPGTYNSKISRSMKVIKSVFISRKARSVTPNEMLPAPGQYDPKGIPSNVRCAASAFRSNAIRLESAKESDSPAPWQYSPNYSVVRSNRAVLTSSFKEPVSARRFQVNIYNPHSKPVQDTIPGPGSYEVMDGFKADSIPAPSAVFLSVENRFTNRTPELGPDPGFYDVSESGRTRVPMSGAVFVSESERSWGKADSKRPGPAFYKPNILPKKQSFHLNLKRQWVS